MFTRFGQSQKSALVIALFAHILMQGVAAAEPLNNIKTIIIDAGHGASDFGAKNRNIIIEKDFTLKIAFTLKKLILKENKKNINVVLTRSNKRGVEQEDRAFKANRNRGDLYLSLHAASGFDQSSRDLGIYIMSSKRGMTWKDANAGHAVENEKLAEHMIESLNGFYQHKNFVIRRGEFIPLFGIDMPALLIEAVSLNDPRDELYLIKREYYKDMANAIYIALTDYDKAKQVIYETDKEEYGSDDD